MVSSQAFKAHVVGVDFCHVLAGSDGDTGSKAPNLNSRAFPPKFLLVSRVCNGPAPTHRASPRLLDVTRAY